MKPSLTLCPRSRKPHLNRLLSPSSWGWLSALLPLHSNPQMMRMHRGNKRRHQTERRGQESLAEQRRRNTLNLKMMRGQLLGRLILRNLNSMWQIVSLPRESRTSERTKQWWGRNTELRIQHLINPEVPQKRRSKPRSLWKTLTKVDTHCYFLCLQQISKWIYSPDWLYQRKKYFRVSPGNIRNSCYAK